MLYHNHGIVVLDIINNTTNLKVIVSGWQPNVECQEGNGTDGMKQITSNKDVALEFIVRGFCPAINLIEFKIIPYSNR